MAERNLVINKYEVALFPKDFYISDLNILLEEIRDGVDVFSDGNNIILPIPSTAPREIPRLLLRSKDNSVACNLSFDKINIQWINQTEISSFSLPLDKIQDLVGKLSDIIFHHSPSQNKMKRVGYIKEIFFLSQNPTKDISETVFKERLTENLRTFLFNLTFNLTLNNIDCNQVVTIGDGIKNVGNKGKVIMLMKDINTRQDKDMNWDSEKIKTFIQEADNKLDKKDMYSSIFD
ncbi:MAG: hypothetical protein Q8P13_04320 [bacterium]|nr:hypothetical protein [bacterium]